MNKDTDYAAEMAERRKKEQDSRNALFARLPEVFHKWRLLGVKTVTVHYNGEGDSGNVDGPVYDGGSDPSVHQELKDYPVQFVEEHLAAQDLDWYNNDGGFGDYTFDVATKTVTFNTSQRISETVDNTGVLGEDMTEMVAPPEE